MSSFVARALLLVPTINIGASISRTLDQGYLPPTLPPWPPTYNMSLSSLTMTCNSSGWSDPVRGGQFGIVSYDWSNAKKQWAQAMPMDCEERLIQQVDMTRAQSPSARVFVYRNLVWAMPWFTSVREKLDDPAYAGFFLKFDPAKYKHHNINGTFHVPPCAPEDTSKCSALYHHQNQSPAVPTPDEPNPDGSCSSAGCDCGKMPCGGYVFDHRNGSMLRDWILREVVGGPTALGNKNVDGLFIDDFWCSDLICNASGNTVAGCPCSDPVQGPTEVERHSQVDMGLTDEDIRDITIAWNFTMGAVQRSILEQKGYTWSLMNGQKLANAMPILLQKDTCAAQLRAACLETSVFQTTANLFGVVPTNGTQLEQLGQDIAFFLLARGAYAWLGFGDWGMGWPFNPEPAHGTLPPAPHGLPRPTLMDRDFGEPREAFCQETALNSNVFRRTWTKAGVIELDCNTFQATLGEQHFLV